MTGLASARRGAIAERTPGPLNGVLDDFNRADNNTSLGANWTRLNPGGGGGYTSTTLGIKGNAAFDSVIAGANKGSAYWNPTTFTGNCEAFVTIGAVPGDIYGVAVRAINTNGIAVKYYLFRSFGGSGNWWIDLQTSFSATTGLATGATTAFVAGDKIMGRCQTDGSGNVACEFWGYRAATGLWTLLGSATDSSANKITTAGNIGIVIGNPNGSSVGRLDDFGGGNF